MRRHECFEPNARLHTAQTITANHKGHDLNTVRLACLRAAQTITRNSSQQFQRKHIE